MTIATNRTCVRLLAAALALLLATIAASAADARATASSRHAHAHAPRVDRHVARDASTAPMRLFAPTSVWNRPLASNAAVDPASPALVSALVAEVAAESTARIGPWISTASYSTPLYVVGPQQPTVTVALDDPTLPWRAGLQAAFQAVPIPPNARPAAGTDAHLTVYQPSTDRLWELWLARKSADGWHAAWGGAIEHVSTSRGVYDASSWPGAASNWGASASSLPVAAGMMTIEELRAGTIDHALAMAVPSARAGVYALPAQRTDGRNTDPLSLPEGARLRLDPKLDVRALHLPPMAEQMALAAQRYGIVVRDQTHHAIGFYSEDPTPTGVDPYGGAGGLFGGRYPSDLLARFPWRSLRVLKMDLRPASP